MADQEISASRGRGQAVPGGRARSRSEDPALAAGSMCQVAELRRGESYDMDGKFSYSQVSSTCLDFEDETMAIACFL